MIPLRVKDAIDAHVLYGREPGSFVEAVLTNDLRGAFSLADDDSLTALREIVMYCYNAIPSMAWGSRERVEAWRHRFVTPPDTLDMEMEDRLSGGGGDAE